MGFRIEDGSGNGREAIVNVDQRLETYSIAVPVIADAARNGNAYSVVGKRTLGSTSEENVLWIQNANSAKEVHLQSIRVAVKTTGGIVGNSYFNSAYTSGGTAKTPVQLNRGSAKASGVTAYDNSAGTLVVGTAALVEFAEFRMGTTMTGFFTSEGALILGPGDTFLFRATGASADEVAISIFLFETENE